MDNFWFGFSIPTAVPKGRPRATKTGQIYTPKETVDAEFYVGTCAKAARRGPMDAESLLHLDLAFYGTQADIDNLVKLVMDGMNGVVYKDDKQVISLTASVHRKGPTKSVIKVGRVLQQLTIDSAASSGQT